MAIGECKINEVLGFAKEAAKQGNCYSAALMAELCYEMARAQINHPVKEVRPSEYFLDKCKKLCVELGVKLWEDSWAAKNEMRCIAKAKKASARAKVQ